MKKIGKFFLYRDTFNKTIAFLPTITIETHDIEHSGPVEKSINFRFLKLRFVIGQL